MSDSCQDRPTCGLDELREAVCIHTNQIEDACIDKDCVEDLRVYLTQASQTVLENATGVKARCAELLYVHIEVEAIPYNRGYYAIDLTFYYRITADAYSGLQRPTTLCGLAAFSKRVVLCGGTSCAKVFSSRLPCPGNVFGCQTPEAVVEVVDPIILSAKVQEVCACCHPDPEPGEIPAPIAEAFGEELQLHDEAKRLYVTLGQFSTVRLERDSQLRIPMYDYCVPDKECCDDPGCEEDPCELFSKLSFPVDAFYPCRSKN